MKTKQLIKTLVSTCMAMMLLLGNQSIAFAAVSSAEESEMPSAISQTVDESSEEATAADGTINASPNTGLDIAPAVAAFLAFASIPVIAYTSRKRER